MGVPDITVGASGLFVWDPTQDTYQVKDDFSWNKGRHSFKLGFNMTERRMFFIKQSVDKGRFTFDNIYARACPLGNTVCDQARTAAGLTSGRAWDSPIFCSGLPPGRISRSSPSRGTDTSATTADIFRTHGR